MTYPARLSRAPTRRRTRSHLTVAVRHYRSMPTAASHRAAGEPRWPTDTTGDPNEIVGSTEAARIIGHPKPNRLPHGLLELADQVERHDDGTVKKRGWKRETLWSYARTAMQRHTTIINDRLALDRTGVADHLGTHISRVDAFIAGAPDNLFPQPVDGRWYYLEDIDAWNQAHTQYQRSQLTSVDYTGDPGDLVTKADAARIVGYADTRSLDNSTIWRALLELNKDEHNAPMRSSGRTRLRWPRRIVWQAAETRTGRKGRTPGTRTVNRTGDPDELVGATEAARTLGYKTVAGLPKALLEQADEQGPPRRWKRQSLWNFNDLNRAS